MREPLSKVASEIGVHEGIVRLSRDIKAASKDMTAAQARYVVDMYYALQTNRMGTASMIRSIEQNDDLEPHMLLDYLLDQSKVFELQVKNALTAYAHNLPEWDQWLCNIVGIGPVITAGLRAHIDMSKAPCVSSLMRFAGQDPTAVWEKGKRRPWNASLKTLCWKVGESFVKVSGNEKSFYGKYYAERKEQLVFKNETGGFADSAKEILAAKNFGKTTDAYKALSEGQLPQAQIHARAKRLAVKLFLSHYFEIRYRIEFNKEPPAPWEFEHGGHVHRIPVAMS